MNEYEKDYGVTTAQKLNLETAKIEWIELQRFFAQGLIIIVDKDLDLVDTAAKFVEDNSDDIKALMDGSSIRKAEMDDAKKWNDENTLFWAVVAVPWVLVQEVN